MKFKNGQRVTLAHRQYGQIRGTVHVLGNANPYVPLGFTHFTLGKNLARGGWNIIDGWIDSPESRVKALLDEWDVETNEPNQVDLVDRIRHIYRTAEQGEVENHG